MSPYALPDISAADGQQAIVLAQNEHPFPPSEKVQAAITEAMGNSHLYPDSDCSDLRNVIARVHNLQADNIVCGSGSMELMSGLMTAYMSTGDRLLVSEYGYLFMRTLAKLVGARVDVAAEQSFRVDVDAILGKLEEDTRMVFIVNPGNPCGSLIHNDEIRRLRSALPEKVLLLVDEAYAEFAEEGFHEPLFDLIELGNTVITRTFSKIYGLAGLRVGWGYFSDDIRNQVRKVINPGSVSLLSQVAARAAIEDQENMRLARRLIAEQRDYLSAEISSLGLTVLPSQTNFILVDFSSKMDASSAFEFLRGRGLVVRPMGGYGLPACLRINIGTEDKMNMSVSALTDWKQAHA